MDSLPAGVITTVVQPRFIFVRVKGELIPIGTCNGKIKGMKKQMKRHPNKNKKKKIRPMVFRKHPVDTFWRDVSQATRSYSR